MPEQTAEDNARIEPLIIALSTVSVVLVANIFGALLPFLLQRVRVDPAVASNPLVTSVMDVLGLIIYFSIAVLILTPAG